MLQRRSVPAKSKIHHDIIRARPHDTNDSVDTNTTAQRPSHHHHEYDPKTVVRARGYKSYRKVAAKQKKTLILTKNDILCLHNRKNWRKNTRRQALCKANRFVRSARAARSATRLLAVKTPRRKQIGSEEKKKREVFWSEKRITAVLIVIALTGKVRAAATNPFLWSEKHTSNSWQRRRRERYHASCERHPRRNILRSKHQSGTHITQYQNGPHIWVQSDTTYCCTWYSSRQDYRGYEWCQRVHWGLRPPYNKNVVRRDIPYSARLDARPGNLKPETNCDGRLTNTFWERINFSKVLVDRENTTNITWVLSCHLLYFTSVCGTYTILYFILLLW